MITVMGAGGHTGSKISQALLEAGEQVRVLGRTAARLAPLAAAGAEVRTGDIEDATFLARAFSGADAVYTLLPTDRASPDYRAAQDRQGEAIVQAIRASGVRHVVALSSLGAELAEGTGVLEGLHAQEQRLRAMAEVNVMLLRPVSFFENLHDALPGIKHEGQFGDTVEPELAVPMIATRDIAEVAARALRQRDWQGIVVRELLGQRDLSHAEIARMLGARIGRPELAYRQFSEPEMVAGLVQAGLSESFATLYVGMTRAFNEGRVQPRARTAENTTPTRFEDFVDELARAYQHA